MSNTACLSCSIDHSECPASLAQPVITHASMIHHPWPVLVWCGRLLASLEQVLRSQVGGLGGQTRRKNHRWRREKRRENVLRASHETSAGSRRMRARCAHSLRCCCASRRAAPIGRWPHALPAVSRCRHKCSPRWHSLRRLRARL